MADGTAASHSACCRNGVVGILVSHNRRQVIGVAAGPLRFRHVGYAVRDDILNLETSIGNPAVGYLHNATRGTTVVDPIKAKRVEYIACNP